MARGVLIPRLYAVLSLRAWTCRMAQANVEGVAGAVTALSREVSRSSSTIQDLQVSVQDMR